MSTKYAAAVLVSIFFVSASAIGCGEAAQSQTDSGLPYYADAGFTPTWYASSAEVPDDLHAIRAFTLIDQRGETVTEKAFDGKLYVANFFFTSCPGICPMTMANMARLQAEFSDNPNIALLSHSVTPEADSVSALHAFAERMDVLSSNWFLVTGDRAEIYDLGKRYYFADEDLGEPAELSADGTNSADDFLHTESFFLIDQQRRIRGVYNGMNRTAVDQLVQDVQTLLDASTDLDASTE